MKMCSAAEQIVTAIGASGTSYEYFIRLYDALVDVDKSDVYMKELAKHVKLLWAKRKDKTINW